LEPEDKNARALRAMEEIFVGFISGASAGQALAPGP